MFKYISAALLALLIMVGGLRVASAQATAGLSPSALEKVCISLGICAGTTGGGTTVTSGTVNTGGFSASGVVTAGNKVGIGPANYLNNLVADLTVYSDSFAQLYLRTGQGANAGGYFINAESTTGNGSPDQQFYVLQNGQLWAKKLCVGNDGCIDKWNGVNVSEGGGSGGSSSGNISPAGINTGAINIKGDGPIFRIDDKDGGPGGANAYFSMDNDISRLVMKGGEIVLQGTGSGVNGAGGSGGSIQVNQICLGDKCIKNLSGMSCGMATVGAVASLPLGLAPMLNAVPCDGHIPPDCPAGMVPAFEGSGLVGVTVRCYVV